MQEFLTGHDGRLSAARYEPTAMALCGWSGAGKTTLLEALIPRLIRRGLSVAVVKHDAHGVELDTPGKDSDRLFCAGADVCLRGPGEGAARFHTETSPSLETVVRKLGADHDVVLVEGHKDTPLAKVWLQHPHKRGLPPTVVNVLAELPWGGDRVTAAEAHVLAHLERAHRERPVLAGILVGGRSRRMGRPKQMIDVSGEPMIARIAAGLGSAAKEIVLLGDGEVPATLAGCRRLPDVDDSEGPISGLLSAMRWAPGAAWIIASCDLPRLTPAAVRWLIDQRRPGRWAVMPTRDGGVEPLFACYEPQVLSLVEELNRSGKRAPWRLSRHDKVATPPPPIDLAGSWANANTPAQLRALAEGAS